MEHQVQKQQETCEAIQRSELGRHIEEEYTRDIFGWWDLEEACDEWYINNCDKWEDNYFQLFFDYHTPPSKVNIMEGSQKQVMTTNFQSVYL